MYSPLPTLNFMGLISSLGKEDKYGELFIVPIDINDLEAPLSIRIRTSLLLDSLPFTILRLSKHISAVGVSASTLLPVLSILGLNFVDWELYTFSVWRLFMLALELRPTENPACYY